MRFKLVFRRVHRPQFGFLMSHYSSEPRGVFFYSQNKFTFKGGKREGVIKDIVYFCLTNRYFIVNVDIPNENL